MRADLPGARVGHQLGHVLPRRKGDLPVLVIAVGSVRFGFVPPGKVCVRARLLWCCVACNIVSYVVLFFLFFWEGLARGFAGDPFGC